MWFELSPEPYIQYFILTYGYYVCSNTQEYIYQTNRVSRLWDG